MPPPSPSTLLAVVSRFAGNRRSGPLVGYSSFMLLIAIAALAVLTQISSGANEQPGTTIGLSN